MDGELQGKSWERAMFISDKLTFNKKNTNNNKRYFQEVRY